MKRLLLLPAAFCAVLAFGGEPAADTRIDLLKEGTFKPVSMHEGMVTAARGWSMRDTGRRYSSSKKRMYVSGEECFTLSYADGAFSIVFKKPLNPVYKHGSVRLNSRVGYNPIPADHYTFEGRLKFKNGKLELGNGHKFQPSDDWQDFKFTDKKPTSVIHLSPEEGAEYHFVELHEYAEYPEVGGFIALPDGGRLEKILMPENAPYEVRYGLALWRGWLWRITGVALPVETVKTVTGPVKNALVAVKGVKRPGNWKLKVDANGILVTTYSDLEISNAIFDYLRRGLGCAFYQNDCEKIPEMGSIKTLPAIDFATDPMYNYFNSCSGLCARQGGEDYLLFGTRNDVDYYHLPTDKMDHVFNVLVPQERYFKTHPEYFAADSSGNRRTRENPHFTNHCMTNREFMKLLLDQCVKYAKLQYGPQSLSISPGDSPEHCLCPNCVKANGGTANCSNTYYDFHEKLSKRIADAGLKFTIGRGVYMTRGTPPDHITRFADNARVTYCMGDFRCKLHVECEVNAKAIEVIKRMRKFVDDDPQRLSFMHYNDLRPLYMIKQMKGLNKYGSNCYFLWVYRSFHPAIPFVLGRYNLGEDPEKLLKEFEEAYYGKGAPHVHRAFEIAEEFATNYKHTQQEIKGNAALSIWPDGFGSGRTVLDRQTLDRIHGCYKKALKAVGKDKKARKHINRDWLFFLTEDLHKIRPADCRDDAEFKAYVRRLKDFVEAAKGVDEVMHKIDARTFLSGVTGVAIPTTKKQWTREPALRQLLKEPGKYLPRGHEPFPGRGMYFKPIFFRSTFEDTAETRPEAKFGDCRRDQQLLYPTQKMELAIPLAKPSGRPLVLSIEGVRENTPSAPTVVVAVNGREFYRGSAGFSADRWNRLGLSIPPELLKQGDNILTVENASSVGWVAVSEIYAIDVSGDFQDLMAGEKSLWRIARDGRFPRCEVIGGEGKVRILAPDGGETRLTFFAVNHSNPKIAVRPGDKVRMKCRAAGTGELRAMLSLYSPYDLDENGVQMLKPSGYRKHIGFQGPIESQREKLSSEPRTLEFELTIPKDAGLVFPSLLLNDGRAEVTDFSFEIVPGK